MKIVRNYTEDATLQCFFY